MQDYIFDVRVPVEEVSEIRKGKRVKSTRKVFPGYVIVNMIKTNESWYVVRNTRGVTGFVGSGTKPTPLTAEELSECEDVISDVVREGERLIGMGADEQDRTQSIFEINLSGTGGLDGYLPVFSFSKEEKEFRGVRQMVLFRSGAPYAVLEDAAMQMFLLLNGKARQLTVNTQIEGRVVSFRTQQLQLTHTASTAGGAPHLEVCLTGKLDDVTVDGAPVADKEEAEMTREINAYLNREAEMLNQATFARGNDTFHYAWWLKLYDTVACEALLRTGTLYDIATVDFLSELKPV